jgi:hypothetical protein
MFDDGSYEKDEDEEMKEELVIEAAHAKGTQ